MAFVSSGFSRSSSIALACRQHEQLDMAALGFFFHFVHDRHDARSGADD